MTTPTPAAAPALALFDHRPYFEKALAYGLQHGLIDAAKLAAMQTEAPKGMVQIARYFGSEFLRPQLEKARERLVNLVSLHLEAHSGGDLRQAAVLLREHSLLSRSKAGSDMLKALLAMPQSSHFGMFEAGGFSEAQIPLLAEWSLRSLADYQRERALRLQQAQRVEAALWFAAQSGLDAEALHEAAPDAEAVIRTALLLQRQRAAEWPDWVAFQAQVMALRKKAARAPGPGAMAVALPAALPAALHPVVQEVAASVQADLAKILDPALPLRRLFAQTPAFMGRYFWLEDALSAVDDFDRTASSAWNQATGGHSDDSSLLTLFVCLAADTAPKTLLSTRSATTLVRKLRSSGADPARVPQYIRAHAPFAYQEDYLQMWQDFWDEAQATLLSDHDYQLHDALALLRRECNLGPSPAPRAARKPKTTP